MTRIPRRIRAFPLMAVLAVVFTKATAAPVELVDDWSAPGLGGWTSSGPAIVLRNAGGCLELGFGRQSYPVAESGVAYRLLAEDVCVTNLVLRFQAPRHAASGLLLILYPARGGAPWKLALPPPPGGTWTSINVPVTFEAGWRSGPRATGTRFFNDRLSVRAAGVCLLRGGSLDAQEYWIDRFEVRGKTAGAIIDPPADGDGDGLPDTWEDRYGFDPGAAGDDDKDPDGDGMSNRKEFLAGTDPLEAASCLRIEGLVARERGLRLQYSGPSSGTPCLEWTESLDRPWQPLSVDAPTSSVSELLLDTPADRGFFRLRVRR